MTNEEIALGSKISLLEVVNENLEKKVSIEDIDVEKAIAEQFSLNSVKIIKLVIELENYFGIKIPDDDLELKYFIDVNSIVRYIKKMIG